MSQAFRDLHYVNADGELVKLTDEAWQKMSGDQRSALTGTTFSDPSLADQSQKDESDINTIVKRFGITGHLPQVESPPTEEEYTEVFDFQSAMNVVRRAQESFAALDAEVRARFNNDPGRFAEFANNPENMAELKKMGLTVDKVPVSIPVVNIGNLDQLLNRENDNGESGEGVADGEGASGKSGKGSRRN